MDFGFLSYVVLSVSVSKKNMATLAEHEQAMLQSFCWDALSSSVHLAHQGWILFRVLLSRRLRLPCPLSSRQCRCGRSLDVFAPSRCVSAVGGVFQWRVWQPASVEKGGARVATNLRHGNVTESWRSGCRRAASVWSGAAGRVHHVGVSSAL